MTSPEPVDPWLARFHAGERAALESCYRDHFATVMRAVGRVLRGADQETVVHDVFYRVLSDAGMRGSFHGGSLDAWLATVARRQAIDFVRRYGREAVVDPGEAAALAGGAQDPLEARAELRRLLERFEREHVPPKWLAVFRIRFIEQLSQREAARALGIRRTTLAYQEARLRRSLRRFVLRMEAPR